MPLFKTIQFNATTQILVWKISESYEELFDAIILNEKDALVEGYLFSTEKLAENWQMLDDFEGVQYTRVQVKTILDTGEIVQAWTYVMNEQIWVPYSR